VRVLLPPSEAKTTGGRGRPVSARPDEGPLAVTRAALLDALDRLLAGSVDAATSALHLPPAAVADALSANRAVRQAPTTPALRRYTGVVYAGLDVPALEPAAQRLAGRSTLVFSGLRGVVRGDEPVPAYRVPASAALPGVGVVGTYWRPVLDEHLPALLGRGPIVDLRSSDYAAMWRPRGELARRTITVRVLSPLPRGGHGVVSYNSKFAKGRLAAALFTRAANGAAPRSAQDVVAAWTDATGERGELSGDTAVVLYTG
jgi:cytoplasmic iron level regulating protein YaaA (DUF328/UPF0246 family)